MNSEYIDMSDEKDKLMLEYPQESLEFNLLKKVKSQVSKNDDMYVGNVAHYFKVGLSALQCIDDSIRRAENPQIINILDMPCGYGRVLRFLCQRFSDANITCLDILEDAVDFCTQTFSVKGIYSKKNLDLLSLGIKFDLIWCGSLLTHIDAILAVKLFNFFNRHLSDGGLFIFSSHGKFVLEAIKDGRNTYGLNEAAISLLIRSYVETGYGYANYPGQADYGISVASTGWIHNQFNNMPAWKEIYWKERGWDNHHDVFCILKTC